MTFEFLISYQAIDGTDVNLVLRDLLSQALVNSQDEFEEDDIDRMIRISHIRSGEEVARDDRKVAQYTILGFSLELPEMDTADAVVDDFAASLSSSDAVLHSLRFEDPVLQEELAQRAAEIFSLEMKLRRVFSFIYLHAYQREDPYDLLRYERVDPVTPNLRKHDMVAATENQFFHITFSQYISLNRRRELSQVPQILSVLRDSGSYDVFREEVTRRPIANESDAELLDDLQSLLNPIEQMRNCVAHNRRPKVEDRQDYLRNLPVLEKRLDKFLKELAGPPGQAAGEATSASA